MIAPLLALLLAAAPPPLACPKGAEQKGGYDDLEEWCEAPDAYGRPVREGPSRTWYDDGGPRTEERWKAGVRDGPFVERHRNGKVARAGAYRAGAKDGPWRISYESGAPEEESSWRAGVQHGPFVAYWPSGAKRAEGRHCGGAQCGRWRSYDAAGKLLGEADYGEQGLAP